MERRIDTLMQTYDSLSGPGASVAVLANGRVVFARAYGLANLESQQRASRETNYRLASCTKQLTAAAILLLAERGELSIEDPIAGPLPELPRWAQAVTIRQLLTHTSGIVDYEDVLPPQRATQLRDRDVLALLAAQEGTLFVPGSKYRYSNSGYALLAMIVERRAGIPFADFLAANLFAPLQMHTTTAFEAGRTAIASRAYGYSRRSGSTVQEGEGPSPSRHVTQPWPAGTSEWVRTDQSLTSAVLGDGGVYSSVDDLARWLVALDEGTLLSPRSLAMAFTPWVTVTTDGRGVQYGFGWRLGTHQGQRASWHTGETIGFRSAIVRLPERRLAVCVLTNRSEGEPERLAWAIADLYLEAA